MQELKTRIHAEADEEGNIKMELRGSGRTMSVLLGIAAGQLAYTMENNGTDLKVARQRILGIIANALYDEELRRANTIAIDLSALGKEVSADD